MAKVILITTDAGVRASPNVEIIVSPPLEMPREPVRVKSVKTLKAEKEKADKLKEEKEKIKEK